ncbi:DUF6302 family protein [Streptomyces rubiginosohelvolus]|uniref:DUF6302 family protein n=1 Tax=Streptomyces rubiginosohelvolus TaxID=67362 RepID=UPI0035E1F92A
MFHNPEADDHPPVKAELLSPGVACDFTFFKRYLADQSLLELSVAVRILRLPFLAVPVGGVRRGGFYTVSCTCFGLAVRDVLAELEGFPDVRLGSASRTRPGDIVEWGEPSPRLSGIDDQRLLDEFYGFGPFGPPTPIPAAGCSP